MKKVLLIDDDPIFSSIATKASKEYGFEIESVGSIKKFKSRKLDIYDAFLVDYDLADGTGDQVLEFLTKNKIDRPIAMISATNHVEDVFPIPQVQPYSFVSKWQDTDSFFQALKKVL